MRGQLCLDVIPSLSSPIFCGRPIRNEGFEFLHSVHLFVFPSEEERSRSLIRPFLFRIKGKEKEHILSHYSTLSPFLWLKRDNGRRERREDALHRTTRHSLEISRIPPSLPLFFHPHWEIETRGLRLARVFNSEEGEGTKGEWGMGEIEKGPGGLVLKNHLKEEGDGLIWWEKRKEKHHNYQHNLNLIASAEEAINFLIDLKKINKAIWWWAMIGYLSWNDFVWFER